MSSYRQLYPPVRICRSETEIRNLFERHMKILTDQKSKMINEINEWGNNLIRQIQENVNKQKNLIEQEYKNQSVYLQTKCQEYLDTALIYEEKKNREEVRLLLEQCHHLKVQLNSFQYPERSIPFIQIEKVKQDSSSLPTYVNSNQQKLTMTTSDINIMNDLVDKCPACFMIFPSIMGTQERSQHVNKHFGDN